LMLKVLRRFCVSNVASTFLCYNIDMRSYADIFAIYLINEVARCMLKV